MNEQHKRKSNFLSRLIFRTLVGIIVAYVLFGPVVFFIKDGRNFNVTQELWLEIGARAWFCALFGVILFGTLYAAGPF